MASVFKRKGDKYWTACWPDGMGNYPERSTRTTDKRRAERIAQKWQDEAMDRAQGLIDPVSERLAAERARPIGDHVDDYRASLEAAKRDDSHIGTTCRYLTKAIEKLGWKSLGDIRADALGRHLADDADARALSARSHNAAVKAWRAFGRWCQRHGRLATDPCSTLTTRNESLDRRRVRRGITSEELARVLDVARMSPTVRIPRFERSGGTTRTVMVTVTCPDRAWAYLIASGTGFRAGEVSSLTAADFDLNAKPPTITVQAGYSKRRRRDVQPIHPSLAATLRPWIAAKPHGTPVCPLPEGKAAAILRADMRRARAFWIREATTPAERRRRRDDPDFLMPLNSAGEAADFHSLRHGFISEVVASGASVKTAQELARHASPALTIGRYAHTRLYDLTAALPGAPSLGKSQENFAQELRATGTDGWPNQWPKNGPKNGPKSLQLSANLGEPWHHEPHQSKNIADSSKPLQNKDLSESASLGDTSHKNRGGRIRTADLLTPSQTR